MTIKTRILLLSLFLQIIGFSVLVSFNSDFLREEQNEAIKRELNQTINTAIVKIDQGADFYRSKAADLSTLAALYNESTLSKHSLAKAFIQSISLEKDIYQAGVWFGANQEDSLQLGLSVKPNSIADSIKTQETSSVRHEPWFQNGISSPPGIGYWTSAYINQSDYLVMRHIQPIVSNENEYIGVVYIDWDLNSIVHSLEKIEVSLNAFTFLIDKSSEEVLTYIEQNTPSTQPLEQNTFLSGHINLDSDQGVKVIEGVKILDELYLISYNLSSTGLVYGAVTPYKDIDRFVQRALKENITLALLIIVGALIFSFLFVNQAFNPLHRIVDKISKSINIDQYGNVNVAKISYEEKNEFTRIVFALNKLFENVNSNISNLHEANQEIAAWNKTLDDKVALKTEELREKQKDLENSLQRLQDTQDELIKSEKMAALGNLVAGVAHEINTPIGISVTAITFLEQCVQTLQAQFEAGTLTKDQFSKFCKDSQESTQIISSNLTRAADLIKSFKMVAVDQSTQSKRELLLKSYVNELLTSLKPKLKKIKHLVEVDIPDSLRVTTDPGAVSQAITIMIMNSLIHGFSESTEGKIAIQANEEADSIRLVYRDNGKGMTKKELEQLFDPFYTTKRGEGGSGLGAHILYNIVTQVFDGSVEAESSPGHGLNYTIIIPKKVIDKEPPLNV